MESRVSVYAKEILKNKRTERTTITIGRLITVIYLEGGRRPPEILIRPPKNIHSDVSTRYARWAPPTRNFYFAHPKNET
jgi:hypothetical protein